VPSSAAFRRGNGTGDHRCREVSPYEDRVRRESIRVRSFSALSSTASWAADEAIAYLKVDSRVFDAAMAQALVAAT
jgi:hypothetical protein